MEKHWLGHHLERIIIRACLVGLRMAVEIIYFLMLHTVISTTLTSRIGWLLHHVVCIEVIAYVYSAIGVTECLLLRWLRLILLLLATSFSSVACLVLLIILLGISLVKLLVLLWPPSLFVWLLGSLLLQIMLFVRDLFFIPALIRCLESRKLLIIGRTQFRVLLDKSYIDFLTEALRILEKNNVRLQLFEKLLLSLLICYLKRLLDDIVPILVR